MPRAERPAGAHRTMERREASAPPAAGSPGSMRGCRRGCSSLASAVRLMPAMECLLGRMRHLAMLSPGVEAVVDDETRQMGERGIGHGDRGAISGRSREQLPGRLHGGFLDEWHLVLLH